MSSSIYDKNRMNYDFQNNESVKLIPTDLQRIPFDNQRYEAQTTMTLTFSTGQYFLDPDKSYIDLGVSVTGDNSGPLAVNWGKGSVANLFGGVRIYHKSGTQITHNVNLDLWTKAKQYIEKDTFWFQTQGEIQGYLADPYGAGQVWWNETSPNPVQKNFKIKLCDLHPFFAGVRGKIFPPEIIEGLRIELDLNPLGRAFFSQVGGAPVLGYSVSRCNLQAGLCDVQDQASDIVNDIANRGGLKWEFNDVFMTTVQIGANQNDFTVSVDKAVSLAQNMITFTRELGDGNIGFDSHVYNQPSGGIKWNYRIGNILYPYKRQVDNKLDTYTILMDNFNWQCGNNLIYSEWDLYNHCYTTLLRTEDRLLNSGDYLNANKRVELEFQKGDSNPILVHSCLEHRKLLSVNGVNSKVDI